jgi:hypothetical protein
LILSLGILINQPSSSLSSSSTTSNLTLNHNNNNNNNNNTISDMTISNLVVKNVHLDSEGTYSCVAYNSEGRGDSNELFIEVWCEFYST